MICAPWRSLDAAARLRPGCDRRADGGTVHTGSLTVAPFTACRCPAKGFSQSATLCRSGSWRARYGDCDNVVVTVQWAGRRAMFEAAGLGHRKGPNLLPLSMERRGSRRGMGGSFGWFGPDGRPGRSFGANTACSHSGP